MKRSTAKKSHDTRILKASAGRLSDAQLDSAAKVILNGGLVAFPTETVYGLGANTFDGKAVGRIFDAKGRPHDNPMIVHVASIRDLRGVVKKIPPTAEKLIKRFWPGPLTLIFEKSPAIPDEVTAGLDTVAVRMPSDKIALALIEKSVPIAAPSANLSGRPSPTDAKDVIQDLRGRIEMIIDSGQTKFGVESTVLDLKSKTILRPGAVTYEEIKKIVPDVKIFKGTASRPSSPGMKYRHYAPKAKMILFEGPNAASMIEEWKIANPDAAVLSTLETAIDKRFNGNIFLLGRHGRPDIIARNLFSNMRRIDRLGYDLILCEGIPEKGIGMAVMNRLRKAASKIIKK